MAAKINDDIDAVDLSTYDWVGQGVLNPGAKIKVTACGWCHPGGGPAEFARRTDTGLAGEIRYDEAESQALDAAATGNYIDGDFWTMVGAGGPGPSHWRESGVVEVDCLLCHLEYNPPGVTDASKKFYNFGGRSKELTYRNYKWAATVGARLGSLPHESPEEQAQGVYRNKVYGFREDTKSGFMAGVFTGETPAVSYATGDGALLRVDAAGQLKLRAEHIEDRPSNVYCLFCHKGPDAKKRGFAWDAAYDVHAAQGYHCLDCHGLADGRDADNDVWGEVGTHDIGKGYARLGSVQNHKDGTLAQGCADCHPEADTRSAHDRGFGTVSFHLERISCEGCHIPAVDWNQGYLIDMSSGNQVWMLSDGTTVTWPGDFQSQGGFRPFLKRYDPDRDGPLPERYYPFGSKSSAWFGVLHEASGEIRPLPLRIVKESFDCLKDAACIDAAAGEAVLEQPLVPVVLTPNKGSAEITTTSDFKPSVSADADVRAMLRHLAKRGFTPPVFVTGRVRGLDADGNLTPLPELHAESSHDFSINHEVRPADQALGYGPDGCSDCHAADGPLEVTQIREVTDYLAHRTASLDEDLLADQTVSKPMWTEAGFSDEQAGELRTARTADDFVMLSSNGDGGSGGGTCFLQILGL